MSSCYCRPNASFASRTERFRPTTAPASAGPIYEYKDPLSIGARVAPGVSSRGSAAFSSTSKRFLIDTEKPLPIPYGDVPTPPSRVISAESAFKSKADRFPRRESTPGFVYNVDCPTDISVRTRGDAQGRGTSIFRSTSDRFRSNRELSQLEPMARYPTDIEARVAAPKHGAVSSFRSRSERFPASRSSGPPHNSYIESILSEPPQGKAATSAFRSKSERFPTREPSAADAEVLACFPSDISFTAASRSAHPSAVFMSRSERLRSIPEVGAASPGAIYSVSPVPPPVGGASAAFKSSEARFKDAKPPARPEVYQTVVRYPTDISASVEEYCKR
eukprot:RCo036459